MAEKDWVIGSITELRTHQRNPTTTDLTRVVLPKPDMRFIVPPEYVWQVDLFGDRMSFCFNTTVDKFWVRVWTRFFFGTKWTRITK